MFIKHYCELVYFLITIKEEFSYNMCVKNQAKSELLLWFS